MSKKTDTLTDFDKQLIVGMEEVVAHINGESNKGRATVVEFADAKGNGKGHPLSVRERATNPPAPGKCGWPQLPRRAFGPAMDSDRDIGGQPQIEAQAAFLGRRSTHGRGMASERDGVRLCSWFLRATFETKNKV